VKVRLLHKVEVDYEGKHLDLDAGEQDLERGLADLLQVAGHAEPVEPTATKKPGKGSE
jgi:hypothetical protein